jgi:peptidoglycan/LPS O-acetylase OafA/YrhL
MLRDEGTEAKRRQRTLGHVPGLDGLRGLALLIVMAHHAVAVFYPAKYFSVFAGGLVAVEIFFVLSAFLITSLLLNEHRRVGHVRKANFYRRRALRLLPAVTVALAIHVVYASIANLDATAERRSVIGAVFYVTNWFEVSGASVSTGLGHWWTLAVEEQFYLLWPLVTAAVVARFAWRRRAPAVIGLLIVALAIWTALLWRDSYNFFNINGIYMRTDVQAVSILIGAAAAYLWTSGMQLPRHLGLWAIAAGVVIGVCTWRYPVTDPLYYRKFGLTWLSLAAVILVLAAVEGHSLVARGLAWSPLRVVGRVSYGLYLWHMAIYVAIHTAAPPWPAWVQLSVALALSALCTALSWYFVETPFLRRKDRFSTHASSEREPAAAGAGAAYSLPQPAAFEDVRASTEPA